MLIRTLRDHLERDPGQNGAILVRTAAGTHFTKRDTFALEIEMSPSRTQYSLRGCSVWGKLAPQRRVRAAATSEAELYFKLVLRAPGETRAVITGTRKNRMAPDFSLARTRAW